MTLFLSTYINKIDSKGRVSVPAPFRAVLATQSFQGIILMRSNTHECLEGFGWSAMDDIGQRLDRFDLFSSDQDDLATAIFGESVQLPFDGDGRVILPRALIDFASIDGQVSFVGLGRKFQIWSPQLFDARRELARKNVQAKGLTLPKGQRGGGHE